MRPLHDAANIRVPSRAIRNYPLSPGGGDPAGGTLAAPIFGEAISRWYRGRAVGDWAMPGGLVMAQLDRETGDLATAATPSERRYSEYFLPGTEPAALRLDVRRLFTWGPIVF